jgi:hypothetical protein
MLENGLIAAELQPVMHHLARGHALHRLREAQSRGDLGGWRVAAPAGNARVLLTSGGLSLRVLRPVEHSSTPPPGHNYARRAFYINSQAQLLGVLGSQLIALWSEREDGLGVDIRVVRPVGTWRAGSSERIDLDFVFPNSREGLESLTFTPSDDDIILPIPGLDDADDDLNSSW